MNPYDKMLNEIIDFNKYLHDIIAKGYRNDIIKLSAIYHMIKEFKKFKEDSIEQPTICEFEHPEYELSDLEDETIDMQEVDDLLNQYDEEIEAKEPEIILYKNNKEYLNKFKQFMDTMDSY